MTEREKLFDYITDLLVDFDEMGFAPTTSCPDPEAYAIEWRRKITDALESYHKQYENAIVPPCKVGDMLYDIYEAKSNGEGNIRELKVPEIHINFDRRNRPWIIISGYYFAFEDFGKTVFLSREEAEAALKGEGDGN